MAEQISNKGYFGIIKEVTKGTPLTPTTFIPMYSESFATKVALDEDSPIMGNKFSVYQTFLGMRSHGGEVSLLAEPNTASHLFNMLLTKGTTSGVGPYTHPFTLSITDDPKSYTVDIQKGNIVWRYMGAEISEISNDFDKNKMVLKAKISALKSFVVREIESIAGVGAPYTITFKVNYDPSPTTGLVIGDTLQILKAGGTTLNLAVASVVDGISITTTTDPATVVAGDLIYLRAATPSYTMKTPFMWARTEFCFGVDVATALSATQTRIDEGKWTILHKFDQDEGAQRSGSFDPAALVRTLGSLELNVKQFFDTPDDYNRFVTNSKRAMIIRHYSETGYELRVTLNNFRITENKIDLKSGDIIYSEPKIIAVYDTADASAFDVKVINNLATI